MLRVQLQHAFEQQVLHRDIKPGNLLLDVHGNVWVSDFGLAQALSVQDISTTQSVGGTLCYMPPESFTGQFDERSDVYSFGLTLYELLTLKPAFSDSSPAASLKRVAHDSFQPTPPREIDASVPRDLETIVLKAISRDPKRRYATTGEVAADLQRFLDNQPVKARRTTALEILWRWCNRNKLVAGLTTLAFSLVLLVSVVMTFGFLALQRSNLDVQAALVREQYERKRSDTTLLVALSALDDIYVQFAPDDIHDPGESAATESDTGELFRDYKVRPALSSETAIVLENLVRFYDQLGEESGNSLLLSEASTKALGRIGDIHRQLGQHQQALVRYSKALATITSLIEHYPQRTHLCLAGARIHNEVGRVYYMRCDYGKAHLAHHKALKLLDAEQCFDSETVKLYEQARANYFLGRRKHVSASRVAIEQLVGSGRRDSETVRSHSEVRPKITANPSRLQLAINLLNMMPERQKYRPGAPISAGMLLSRACSRQ